MQLQDGNTALRAMQNQSGTAATQWTVEKHAPKTNQN